MRVRVALLASAVLLISSGYGQSQTFRSANTHGSDYPLAGPIGVPGDPAQRGELVQAPVGGRWSQGFRSADIFPASHPTVRAVAYLGVLIQSRTGGRYGISSVGENSRHSEAFMIASVRNGTLDMARVNLAALIATTPEALVPALPGLFRSTKHRRDVLNGPIGRDLLAALESHDLIGLCFYDTGPRSYYGARPVRSAKDLAGLSIRVPQPGAWASLLDVTGAKALPMPYSQVTAALRSRAVDLAEGDWISFVASGHYKVSRYFSETEHSATPSVLIFSKRRWQELTEADQKEVRRAAQDSVREFQSLEDDSEANARRTVKEAGVEVVSDVDRGSFLEASASVYQQLSPKLHDLVRRIKAMR